MRHTTHLSQRELRKLLFRKATPEEVAEREQAQREAGWLLALNFSEEDCREDAPLQSLSLKHNS